MVLETSKCFLTAYHMVEDVEERERERESERKRKRETHPFIMTPTPKECGALMA
jgi:hypothetical protein